MVGVNAKNYTASLEQQITYGYIFVPTVRLSVAFNSIEMIILKRQEP